ncbi:MAG: dihydroorotase [Lachnospiraceae bacterium]|nr:dihydroorotase [Lachnospiraceae bacterium]
MMLIKNGRVMDPASGRDEITDVLVKDGLIEKIADSIDEKEDNERKLIDATGMVVCPGFVDVHAHFRDPGQTEKEDLATGERAAIAGGYTSVVLMANTVPAIDSTVMLNSNIRRTLDSHIHIYHCAAVTNSRQGRSLVNMEALKEAGAPGFTDDGSPILDTDVVREAMETAARLGMPLSFHEEDPAYISEAGINAGEVALKFGLKGADRQAEISMVKRDIALALETGAKIDIQHVSAKETVELIRQAKKNDPDGLIHAEATPHHFSLTEKAVEDIGNDAKVNPPLRTEEDRLAIIEGLKDGTIDMIATDHAPHTMVEKRRSFIAAPSGMIGLETALALGMTNLVHAGHLSLMRLIELMSYGPARFYGFNAGELKEGGIPDITIFDPDEKWTVKRFNSKSSNSPFIGKELTGKVHYTIASGKEAWV